jgi:hypothetical protein
MSRKNISKEKIIQAFLMAAFEKSAGGISLTDVAENLQIKKASLYNHFEGKDAMYNSTIEYCGNELSKVSFLMDKTIYSIKNNKIGLTSLFKKLITRYINIFEMEPLFQIYVFINTEKYFNINAMNVVQNEYKKFKDEINQILQSYQDTNKISKMSNKVLSDYSDGITSIINQKMDFYLFNRKEEIRQNPESGVGSLFALDTNSELVDDITRSINAIMMSI